MQEKARAVLRPRPQTRVEVLRRYPRLVAHMICVSLGYFTPAAAAGALLDYIRGEPDFCEYYTHMAGGWDREKLLKVGRDVVARAFSARHHHQGFMAHYPLARQLVQDELQGQGPIFASWF